MPAGKSNTDHFREWIKIAGTPRIALLIEDSADETDLVILASKDFNIRWEVAHTGNVALEKMIGRKIRNEFYQLIILDINLNSNPDGVELFRRIKEICPLCPVLVLSGYITNEVIVEITEIGFAMFAQKPSAFTSDFFEQLFLALNITKLSQAETKSLGYTV